MIYDSTDINIKLAAESIISGNLVAFPTETVYGLGANALDHSAVQKIFSIKGRPSNNPLIVHLATIEKISEVADIDTNRLIESRLSRISKFWPGPLSVVLPKAESIPKIVTAGGNTIAIRIPAHPVALKLLQQCQLPIAAPSANPSGYISPTTAQHVDEILGETISIIIDGGASQVGIESSVISFVNDKVTLLRPGVISIEELEETLNEKITLNLTSQTETSPLLSPGLLLQHYSPSTLLKFIDQLDENDRGKKIGYIQFSPELKGENWSYLNQEKVYILSQKGDLQEVASKLFYTLRELDKLSLDLIAVERCQDKGIGLALMDRLLRASKKLAHS